MKNLLIVKSSIRDGRVADKVAELVQAELANHPEFSVTIADFKDKPLPFFDSAIVPAAEGFTPTDPNVLAWTKQVGEADAVMLLTAEYNHSYTPIIKNAIDWIYKEWNGKPVALVGYGWVGGARAIKHLRDVLASNIAARAIESEANLRFTKEINTDGTVIDQTAINDALKTVLEELKQTVLEPVAA